MKRRDAKYSGFWWDPAKPDETWAGTLRLSRQGRARLTLIVAPSSLQAFMIPPRIPGSAWSNDSRGPRVGSQLF